MKKIKIKNYTVYSIISLLILTSITYWATSSGSIWSLFSEVTSWVYKLKWWEIIDNSITSTQIWNSAIGLSELNNNAVSSAKIIDGTIISADLANNSINSIKIINGSIISDDLANNSIDSANILNNTISEDDIIDTFKARDSDKLQWKTTTTSLGTDHNTIPTSLAIRNSLNLNNLSDVISTTNNNIWLWWNSLSNLSTWYQNVWIGNLTLNKNTSWFWNLTAWHGSSYNNISWDYNVSLWRYSLYNNKTWDRNITIGNLAWFSETWSNKLYIENSSTTKPLIYGDFSSDELTINWTLYSEDASGVVNEVLTTTDLDNFSSDIFNISTGDSLWQCPPLRVKAQDKTSKEDEYLSYAACIPIDNWFRIRFPFIWDSDAYKRDSSNAQTLLSNNINTAKQVCRDYGMGYQSKESRSGTITVFDDNDLMNYISHDYYNYYEVTKTSSTQYIEYLECVHLSSLDESLVPGLILSSSNIWNTLTIEAQWGWDPEGCHVNFTDNDNININTIPWISIKNWNMFISKWDEMNSSEWAQCPNDIKEDLNAWLPNINIKSVTCNNSDVLKTCTINY